MILNFQRNNNPLTLKKIRTVAAENMYTVRKDPLNDLGALMFLKNVLKFGLKNSEE